MAQNEKAVESIQDVEPEYVPHECPHCKGRVAVFGAEDRWDFSKVKVICWECGRHMYFTQDAANRCYHLIEE